MTEPTRFKDVDGTNDAAAHASYLDTVSAVEIVARWKRRSIELLDLRPGDEVLEVGCGNGEEARAMAARVTPNGHVVAIDVSQRMLDEARSRGTTGVTFTQMDAHDLRFPSESFDACRCERTLQHVDDPPRVVHEMARVLRRGRRLVLMEPDWETLLVNASDVTVTRRILDHQVDSPGHPHGRIGRRLVDLVAESGLRLVAAEGVLFVANDFPTADAIVNLTFAATAARDHGIIAPEQAASWLAELSDRSRRGTFIGSMAGYLAVAEKP